MVICSGCDVVCWCLVLVMACVLVNGLVWVMVCNWFGIGAVLTLGNGVG